MEHELVDTETRDYLRSFMARAVCSCGWKSEWGGRDEVAREFTMHATKGEELRSLFR
jgi:hypothetical protein